MTKYYDIAVAMKSYGGAFVSRLGEALAFADPNNVERIKAAFPEYWEEYSKLAQNMTQYKENP